jgi:putative membrane protein (TIGR04086 family)
MITFLYHKNIINTKIVTILEITSLIISTITTGLYLGLKSKNKGYINGLSLSGIIIGILLILNILISKKITLINIIIYSLILIITTTSSIIGINKRR